MIKIVNKDISDIKIGNKQVIQVYLGSELVWGVNKDIYFNKGDVIYEIDGTPIINLVNSGKRYYLTMKIEAGVWYNFDLYDPNTDKNLTKGAEVRNGHVIIEFEAESTTRKIGLIYNGTETAKVSNLKVVDTKPTDF